MTGFSLQEIILMLIAGAWRRRYALLVPILFMPPLALIGSKLIPKQYEAKMTILVQEPGKSNPFLNDWAVAPNIKDRMPALKAMLLSEHVLGSVLEDLGKINAKTPQEIRNNEVEMLASNIKSVLIGAEIVTISLKSKDKANLAKTLNLIGARFTERLLSPERSAINNSEQFLQQQLEQKRRTLSEAEEKLSQFKTENADKLPAIYSANVQRLSSLREKLDEKQKELTGITAAFQDLKARIKTTNPMVGRIEESIVQLSAELIAMKSRYTDEHSEVISAERRLMRLKEEREQSLVAAKNLSSDDVDRMWNMAASAVDTNDKGTMPLLVGQMQRFQEAQSKRVALEADVALLHDTISTISSQIAQYAPIEQQQSRLERGVTAARELFELLSKRYELARITGALGQFEAPERVKIIDPPRNPTGPINIPAVIFIIVGLVAGIIMGCALAVAFEITDNSLRSTRQYNAYFTSGVITRLPRVRASGETFERLRTRASHIKQRDLIFAYITKAVEFFIAMISKYAPGVIAKIKATSKIISPIIMEKYKNTHFTVSPSLVPDIQKRENLLKRVNELKEQARKAAKVDI